MRPGQWICLSRVFAWRGELADALPGEVCRGSLEVRPHRLDRGHWWPMSAPAECQLVRMSVVAIRGSVAGGQARASRG